MNPTIFFFTSFYLFAIVLAAVLQVEFISVPLFIVQKNRLACES